MQQYKEEYMLDLCVRMAHHSTAIEGNTLTQDETASILLNGYIGRAMQEREFYEVKNYKKMFPFIIQSIQDLRKIDNELIKEIHNILMDNLIDNKGHFKKIENLIVGSNLQTTKPFLVPATLKNLNDNLNFRLQNTKDEDEKILAILEYHIKFEEIHPFSDGNGRTGRTLMVYSCLEQDLVPIVISKESKNRYIHILRTKDIKDFFYLAKELQTHEKTRIDLLSVLEHQKKEKITKKSTIHKQHKRKKDVED